MTQSTHIEQLPTLSGAIEQWVSTLSRPGSYSTESRRFLQETGAIVCGCAPEIFLQLWEASATLNLLLLKPTPPNK